MGRFLINVMLASGGYPWTVVLLETRNDYRVTLEEAIVSKNIRPFFRFLAELVRKSIPEMDWWYGRISPSGNKLLVNAVKKLCEWIPANFDIQVFHFPYHIEQGGIYLKDAAVMAGLGCIGRNNMVVTPEFGPRMRLRAIALSVPIPSTGPSGFDPCVRCDDICRKTCPQHAFDKPTYSPETYNLAILPGRDGTYARPTCNLQMQKNNDDAKAQIPEGFSKPVKVVKYCRMCEWSCPVGKIKN